MISQEKLLENVNETKSTTKAALETIFESLNKGQQKKLLKDAEVRHLLEFYGVIQAAQGGETT